MFRSRPSLPLKFSFSLGIALLLGGRPAAQDLGADSVIVQVGVLQGVLPRSLATVVVYHDPSGGVRLRLHNLHMAPQAGLKVWLYKTVPSPGERNLEGAGNFLTVGDLRRFAGNVEYPLPGGIDMAGFHSVVVWSGTDKQVIAVAPLN